MPGTLSRLVYVDDSGDNQRGWMVYGWVEINPADWAPTLRQWLEFRKQLWVDYSIPVHQELHTTEYVMGRSRISKNVPSRFVHDGQPYWKDLGREVAELVVAQVASLPGLRVGAVARHTDKRGSDYASAFGDLYRDLVQCFDDELEKTDDLMMIAMDGDGSNPSYFAAHRNLLLDQRHVIEDPMFHDSKRSQWTQLADLIAYAAHASVHKHSRNEFAQEWWGTALAPLTHGTKPFDPPRTQVRD